MKRTAVISALTIAGFLAMPSTVGLAHHSVQNEFNVDEVLVKTGVLRKIDWINPHAWFHFTEVDAEGNQVLDENGRPIVWSIETTGPGGLRSRGLADRRVFEIGEIYAFSGYPHRHGETKMFTLQVRFPDNRLVTLGFPEDAPDLTAIELPDLPEVPGTPGPAL